MTEVVSSIDREGQDVPHNLAMGTYVVVESDSAYARQCFVEYNLLPDKSGKYAALYRPTHMIGLELGISVASAALRKEPTGAPICFNSDVVATAKRALKKGEMLDGEGGFCVWGKQTPADVSLREGYLPLGLAHDVKLKRDIAEGQPLRWSDVADRRELRRGEGAARDGGDVRQAERALTASGDRRAAAVVSCRSYAATSVHSAVLRRVRRGTEIEVAKHGEAGA